MKKRNWSLKLNNENRRSYLNLLKALFASATNYLLLLILSTYSISIVVVALLFEIDISVHTIFLGSYVYLAICWVFVGVLYVAFLWVQSIEDTIKKIKKNN